MRILILDDKAEERSKALEAAQAKGFECVVHDPTDREWPELVDGVDGVVTDLFWTHRTDRADHRDNLPPSGLLVVIHALSKGKPAVICTDVEKRARDGTGDRQGHHGLAAGFIHDGYVHHWERVCPFGWVEDKDWSKAIDMLVKRMAVTS